MSILDDLDALREQDAHGFLGRLATLPGSYAGPDGQQPGPYGLTAYGEAAVLGDLLRPWLDGPLVASGTQFLLAGGFAFGELGALQMQAEAAGAKVLVLGPADPQPSWGVDSGPLAPYHYVGYLAHAVGRGRAFGEIQESLAAIARTFGPETPTEGNAAKALAWAVWDRAPLLVTSRAHAEAQPLLQQLYARVGRGLLLPTGPHPGGVLSGALEGRRALGDDLLALLVGEDDPEMELARELLATRVPQIEGLDWGVLGVEPPDDPVLARLVLWYALAWVSAYTAILHQQAPGESELYRRVADAAEGGSGEEPAEA